MPTLVDAGDAMLLRDAVKGLSHLVVEVEDSLVDEDVESCALEYSLDLGKYGLYKYEGLGKRRSTLTNWVKLGTVADIPNGLNVELVVVCHHHSLVEACIV